MQYVIRLVSYEPKTKRKLSVTNIPAASVTDARDLADTLNTVPHKHATVCVRVHSAGKSYIISLEEAAELADKLNEIVNVR